jgi:hypothetical protein
LGSYKRKINLIQGDPSRKQNQINLINRTDFRVRCRGKRSLAGVNSGTDFAIAGGAIQ